MKHFNPSSAQRRYNFNLPTLWFDSVHMTLRHDVQTVTFLFYASHIQDESLVEVARLTTNRDHVARMITALCETIGFWPEPPKGKRDRPE